MTVELQLRTERDCDGGIGPRVPTPREGVRHGACLGGGSGTLKRFVWTEHAGQLGCKVQWSLSEEEASRRVL